MKKLFNLLFLCLLGTMLVACSNDENFLIRIDVQRVASDDSLEDEDMILDLITLDSIKSLLEEVKWEPEEEPEDAGSEDLIATLFYADEKDKPDELYLYRIWYNFDDTITIISNNEEEGYGKLDEEYADKLKSLLESEL
ncbi:hypothetical protein [Ureibacillus chungkukjangi]|uniref:Lipoprotein n=1 Tax=Ureibacillus chungkukjangi TaxID=1202712 RepID=A0A318TQX9_9BACL|nr:hypothetical protein [Ureibacillus chungkukjangi]PYF07246.1 hypothetical protein BJ095_10536 [Ureibacillus chungkukjangi]